MKRRNKLHFIIIGLIFVPCILTSCKKYVDIKRNSSQTLIETANDCQLLLNNYGSMNTQYPSDGEVSADDYYLTDQGYLNPVLSATDRDLYVWAPRAIRAEAAPHWQLPYRIVYFSNLVLETMDNLNEDVDQATRNNIRGQALFFRAYAVWNLAQSYCRPFAVNTANLDLGVPIRLSSDINGVSERGTVQETYAQIVRDLEESVNLLPVSSVISSRPNKVAAYAMLARVYLSMGNYQSALQNSTLALEKNSQLIDYNTLDVTSMTPFERFNKEVIFQSVMATSIVLYPGSESDNICKINLDLCNSYDSNDLRSKIFIKPNSEENAGSFRFSGNYEPDASGTFFNGLAVDEVYLIRSECYARLGNLSSALIDLNSLLRTRWTTGTYVDITAANMDDALSKILLERRKELLMRGQRWTDLRRLNLDPKFSRVLSRTVNGNNFTLPPNDNRYVLLIPNEVILNSQIVQNPR